MSVKNDRISSIFRRFPRVDLGILPTPLHRLERMGWIVGHSSLWIKRDDLTGLAMGGTKTRSLEFLVGDALSMKADTIVAAGPLQSNHCCLLGAAAARTGLDCIFVHNDERPTELRGSQLLNSLLGVQSRFIGKKDENSRRSAIVKLAQDLESKGKRPYVIHSDPSMPLGLLGYAYAAFELYEQCRVMGISLQHVVLPGGNGGTAAGFVVGASLLGHPFHVHVINVELRTKPALPDILYRFIAEAEKLLDLRLPLSADAVMTVYEDYRGKGWGIPTRESLHMVSDLPRLEGIFIEQVYTSKTLAGMVDLIRRGIIPCAEGLCFWHTGGIPSLFAQMS